MNAFTPFLNIFSGWSDILAGNPAWREKLPGNAAAVAAALFVNLICVLAVLALRSALVGGLPSVMTIAVNVAFSGILITAMWLVILITRLVIRFEIAPIGLLVPTIHALSLLLILQFVMSLFGGELGWAMYGVFAYMMFRLGRVGAEMNLGVAMAFAAFATLLLVGVPIALYMLLKPGPGPI